MSEHILNRLQTINLPRDQVFDFFADAGNLERITPPALKFQIISPQPIEIRKGALIDYRLRMRGIPISWQTEISVWDPPYEFVDQQLRGPYRQWIHRHTFTAVGPSETVMEDEVRYRLPFEPVGDIFHFIVRRELDQIFDYRQRVVADIRGRG